MTHKQRPYHAVRAFMYLLADEADLANAVALGDGLGQLQLAAEAFRDAPVTAHGVVAEGAQLFIGAALLLPGLHQRAVVEIDIQVVVGAALDLHFEHQPGRKTEQRLFESL